MRLYEFSSSKSPIESSLIGILSFLRYRAHNFNAPLDISTTELVSMIQKSGVPFSYEALVSANKLPTIQNLISSFDDKTVKLKPVGDEFDKTDPVINTDPVDGAAPSTDQPFAEPQPQPQQQMDPQQGGNGRVPKLNRVDQMAKQALSRRQ